MTKRAFKVGDRVRFVGDDVPEGMVGTVVHDDGTNNLAYTVKFDGFTQGHSGDLRKGYDKNDVDCWHCAASELETLSLAADVRVGDFVRANGCYGRVARIDCVYFIEFGGDDAGGEHFEASEIELVAPPPLTG